jgi:hypothetical protein
MTSLPELLQVDDIGVLVRICTVATSTSFLCIIKLVLVATSTRFICIIKLVLYFFSTSDEM